MTDRAPRLTAVVAMRWCAARAASTSRLPSERVPSSFSARHRSPPRRKRSCWSSRMATCYCARAPTVTLRPRRCRARASTPMTRATCPRLGWRWAGAAGCAVVCRDRRSGRGRRDEGAASAGLREPIPHLSLSVTRESMIASGRLYYLVRLRNFLREPVTTTASLAVASDFADMFEVRGGGPPVRAGTRFGRGAQHRGPTPRLPGSARVPACTSRPAHGRRGCEARRAAADLRARRVLRGLGPQPET